jgi:hypothetical protein
MPPAWKNTTSFGLGSSGPAERLVEGSRAGQVGDAEGDEAKALLHSPMMPAGSIRAANAAQRHGVDFASWRSAPSVAPE